MIVEARRTLPPSRRSTQHARARGKRLRKSGTGRRLDAAGLGPREAAGEPFDMRILSIDRTGRAAVAKVAMRWNGRDDVDCLSMIRRDEGGWSISEKTFHSPT